MDSVAKLLLSKTNLASPSLSEIRFYGSNKNAQPILVDFQQGTVISKNSVELIQDSSDLLFQIPYELESVAIHIHRSHNDKIFYIHKVCRYQDSLTERFKVNAGSTLIEIRLKKEDVEDITIHVVLEENNSIVSSFRFYRKPPSEKQLIASSPITSTQTTLSTSTGPIGAATSQTTNTNAIANPPTAFPVPKTIEECINPYPVSTEDGPIFRETLSDLEQLIPKLVNSVRSVVDKLSSYENHSKQLFNSRSHLINSLSDLSKLFPSSYGCDFNKHLISSLQDVTDENRSVIKSLREKVSNTKPLSLETTLATNKKNFEEESKKYYEWISRLLSSGKSKDEKLLLKRKSFEVSKLGYFNFLYDTAMLLSYNFVDPETEFSKSYKHNKSERHFIVQKIDNALNMAQLNVQLEKITAPPTSTATKSGILFTQGGQGKSGWHKQWVVLKEGKLTEYMDWRKGTAKRNDPIDISLCNIKPMEVDKRKNCFRIITSTGMEHYFQAISENDRDSWIQALYDAGQDIRFRKSMADSQRNARTNKHLAYVENSDTRARRVSSVSLNNLKVVQSNSNSNLKCCDCQSADSVEWVSINLLVVFCVKCSSCHRSLGTSISKVKSLKLDSFTPESLKLLTYINNDILNSIYEETLPPGLKINPQSNDEDRLNFITNKYSGKRYVNNNKYKSVASLLIHGIKRHNIQEILNAFALSVDTNINVTKSINNNSDQIEISLLEYALSKPSMPKEVDVPIFDTAELLILNGISCGSKVENNIGLEDRALQYWQSKIDRLQGGGAGAAASPGVLVHSHTTGSISQLRNYGNRNSGTFVKTGGTKLPPMGTAKPSKDHKFNSILKKIKNQ